MDFQQAIGENWKLRTTIEYLDQDSSNQHARRRRVFFGDDVIPDGTSQRENTATVNQFFQGLNVVAQLQGDFQTGRVRHNFAFGYEYGDSDGGRDFRRGTDERRGTCIEDGTCFNIFDPVYGLLSPDVGLRPGFGSALQETNTGFFVFDNIHLSDRWLLNVGARWDDTEASSHSFTLDEPNVPDGTPDGSDSLESPTEFGPQIGLIRKFGADQNVSVYASYSEGFRPNSGTDEDGNLFDPQKAKQIEIGVKGRYFDGKVNATLAVYDLEKDNVLEFTIDQTVEITGVVESKGVELDVVANPAEDFNILGSIGYLDNQIKGRSPNFGNRVRNVAEYTASLWGSYEVHEGPLTGLGGGLGLFHSGDRFGENDNDWSLGAYTVFDASLWYYIPTRTFGDRQSQIKIQANIKNLTDELYFAAAGSINRINPGAPRTFIVTASYEF